MLTVIATCVVNAIVYAIAFRMGIRYHKNVIQSKQSIGVLVIEEVDNEPVNLYLAIDSYDQLKYEGSEVVLRVKRK